MDHVSSTTPTAPTPAVVLALGRLGLEVTAEVERIFLSGDERRAAVTRFLALADGGDPAFVPVSEVRPRDESPTRTRREVCQRLVAEAPRLRASLEAAFHDLRTHERLVEAGLGEVHVLPLDLIVVADLTESEASGALVPLAYMVQGLLAHEPEGMGHLLLSTARFIPADEGEEARLYATLKELDALADLERASAGQPLAETLGREEARPLSLRLYLFDHCKEGMREVKDRRELRAIVGNFLLALLSGGLAQRLGRGLPRPERLERRAFYSGAAAAALVFEPRPLIDACAAHMGAEFVATEMKPGAEPDPQLAGELAREMREDLGDLRSWLGRLCADTPYEVRAGVDECHLGLHLADFHFERTRKEDWAEAIADYDALFGRMRLPRHQDTMEENAAELAEEALARQARAIEGLPQAARLYPGGLRTARRALEKLDGWLEDRLEALSTEGQAAPSGEEGDLEALERAAGDFPDPPVFFARLLLVCVLEAYVLIVLGAGLRGWAAVGPWLGWMGALLACAVTVGACLLWLRRKDRRLVALRDRCVRDLERRYAALLEEEARDRLVGLGERLRAQVAEAIEDLKELEGTLEEVRERLTGRWVSYPEVDSLFRPSPADEAFAGWAYRRWRQPPSEMRHRLLQEHRLLAGWQDATSEELAARFLAYGREVFAPLSELTLEDALRRRGDDHPEALLLTLARDARPLLRPDFDPLGGGGYAHRARYVLVGDSSISTFGPALEGPLADWEVIDTGDSHLAICCHIRHMIPLAALRDLTRRGREVYEELDPDQRRTLHLFDEWAEL